MMTIKEYLQSGAHFIEPASLAPFSSILSEDDLSYVEISCETLFPSFVLIYDESGIHKTIQNLLHMNLSEWSRLKKALEAEYDILVDEEYEKKNTGDRTQTGSISNAGTNTNQTKAFDSSEWSDTDKSSIQNNQEFNNLKNTDNLTEILTRKTNPQGRIFEEVRLADIQYLDIVRDAMLDTIAIQIYQFDEE